MNFTHVFSLEELNQILEALVQKPFKEVAALVQRLHKEANEQATAAQAAQQIPLQTPDVPVTAA